MDNCWIVIPDSINQRYISDEMRQLYDKKLVVSYTAKSLSIKWCPNKNCEYGVEKASAMGRNGVLCKCGTEFCVNCGLENHEPCNCECALQWRKTGDKILQEIMRKICPSCFKPTEINSKSAMVTCTRCLTQFCWICNQNVLKHEKSGCQPQVVNDFYLLINRTFTRQTNFPLLISMSRIFSLD